MLAQRNCVAFLTILALLLTAAMAHAEDKTLPSTQPAATTTTPAAEPAARDIPLEKVWAYQMPGTRAMDVSAGPGGKGFASTEGKSVSEILAALKDFGGDVRGGFPVMGTGAAALTEAHKVLAETQSPAATLDRNQKISLVFFSYQSAFYVHLKKITQKGSLVEISYEFVPRDTKDFTPQIAIIPLFDVPPGTLKIVLHSENDPTPVDPHDVAGQSGQPFVMDCSFHPGQ